MKVTALLLFLVLGYPPKVQNPQCVPTTTPPRDDAVRLQLNTSIAEAHYSVEYGSRMLSLTLNLNYLNVGGRPILLDRKSSHIYRRLVSKDLKAVSACKYLEDVSAHIIGAELMQASDPDRSEFVTLQPKESVTFQKGIKLRLYDGTQDAKDDLHPGSYVLQVRVATWFYFADPVEWERNWGDQAYVWSENVTSEPMPFTIEKLKAR